MIDENKYVVSDLKNKKEYVAIKGEKLNCECGFYDKTGISCCHVIKICLMFKFRMLREISRRWIIDVDSKNEMMKKKLGFRKTRRNRH